MSKTNLEKELEKRTKNGHDHHHSTTGHQGSCGNGKHCHGDKCTAERCPVDSINNAGEDVVSSLQEKIKVLSEEILVKNEVIKNGEERVKLVAADFLNSKNRLEKEAQNTKVATIKKFVLPLVKIIENIDLSLSYFVEEKLNENEKLMFQGIKMTKSSILSIFETFSIEKIEARKGDKFDYNLQQAVTTIVDDTIEAGTVFEVISNGYKMFDNILVPAMVSVTKKSS